MGCFSNYPNAIPGALVKEVKITKRTYSLIRIRRALTRQLVPTQIGIMAAADIIIANRSPPLALLIHRPDRLKAAIDPHHRQPVLVAELGHALRQRDVLVLRLGQEALEGRAAQELVRAAQGVVDLRELHLQGLCEVGHGVSRGGAGGKAGAGGLGLGLGLRGVVVGGCHQRGHGDEGVEGEVLFVGDLSGEGCHRGELGFLEGRSQWGKLRLGS